MVSRDFEILGPIRNVQIIAVGRGVILQRRLQRKWGGSRWRKLKGVALIREYTGSIYEAEIHWFEAHGVGQRGWKIKSAWRNHVRKYPYLAICIRNDGSEASLEMGKAYRVVKPLTNDPDDRIRVIDEENEDYLYRADWFVPIQVPPAARRSVLKAVSS